MEDKKNCVNGESHNYEEFNHEEDGFGDRTITFFICKKCGSIIKYDRRT